jgi:hypothetical protein
MVLLMPLDQWLGLGQQKKAPMEIGAVTKTNCL